MNHCSLFSSPQRNNSFVALNVLIITCERSIALDVRRVSVIPSRAGFRGQGTGNQAARGTARLEVTESFSCTVILRSLRFTFSDNLLKVSPIERSPSLHNLLHYLFVMFATISGRPSYTEYSFDRDRCAS